LNIERRKISELKNDPANARKHSPRNLKAIRDSLDVFGQQKPIVVDARGVVIAGNGTLEAARDLGWDEIDVAVTDLDPAHAQAFGIADNRTAELANVLDLFLWFRLHTNRIREDRAQVLRDGD